MNKSQIGYLAKKYCKLELPLLVLRNIRGFCICTFDDEPISRESEEFYPSRELAEEALKSGCWTQRHIPPDDESPSGVWGLVGAGYSVGALWKL